MQTTLPRVPSEFQSDPPILGEFDGFVVYPMPAFVRFPVPDPEATARWYVDRLGFGIMYVGPEVHGSHSLIHLRRRKYQDILLVPGASGPGSFHLDATGELAAIAEQCGEGDAIVTTPYNTRELTVTDPDGHVLVLFEAIPVPDTTIDDVMSKSVEAP